MLNSFWTILHGNKQGTCVRFTLVGLYITPYLVTFLPLWEDQVLLAAELLYCNNLNITSIFTGVYIVQNTMARGGGRVPGEKMKNEAVGNKMKKKEKGKRKKKKRKRGE